MQNRHLICTCGMQRPVVCIFHSVWVCMALQTCPGPCKFLCHGEHSQSPLTSTQHSCSPQAQWPSSSAGSFLWVCARAALELVWTYFVISFGVCFQSPGFYFSFTHVSELRACFSFSVCSLWVKGTPGGLVCLLARRPPQALHAVQQITWPGHRFLRLLENIPVLHLSFTVWNKARQGSGRECVYLFTHHFTVWRRARGLRRWLGK
jgi:hypothetical protein